MKQEQNNQPTELKAEELKNVTGGNGLLGIDLLSGVLGGGNTSYNGNGIGSGDSNNGGGGLLGGGSGNGNSNDGDSNGGGILGGLL